MTKIDRLRLLSIGILLWRKGGRRYYVNATSGNDSNTGESSSHPWQTIAKINGEAFNFGDCLLFSCDETWTGTRITVSYDGLRLRLYGSGNKPIIDGTGMAGDHWQGLVHISGHNNIEVSDLQLQNSIGFGVFAYQASGVQVNNCYTYNTAHSGLYAEDSDHIYFLNNEVELACNDLDQECISVATVDTFEIAYNDVHDGGPGTNGGEGIDAKGGSHDGTIHHNEVYSINRLGIYVDAFAARTYNIDVYNNKVHDCANNGMTVASEQGGLLEYINFYNNLVYRNAQHGFDFSPWNPAYSPNPLHHISVINNTFFYNGFPTWGGGIHIGNTYIENVILRNNIVSGNKTFTIKYEDGVPTEQMTIDHNCIEDFKSVANEIKGTNYQEGDPSFVDENNNNYHIQSGSICRGNGSSTAAPELDYDGVDRGASIDIGAYEYVA